MLPVFITNEHPMRIVFPLFLLCVLVSVANAAASTSYLTPQSLPDQIEISEGALEGIQENGVWSFKGIPYAQPPVGDLRWREPQPVGGWAGVRRANRFGARPMQPTLWSDM